MGFVAQLLINPPLQLTGFARFGIGQYQVIVL